MRKPAISFLHIASELDRLHQLREQMTLNAFDALECRHAGLAELLVTELGDRRRAAHWMSQRHRAFDGRSAYKVIADGEEGAVWDELERTGHLLLLSN